MEIIGIHRDELNLFMATLKGHKGEVEILSLEKQTDQIFTLKEPIIATGIEGQDLLIRRFVTPLKKSRALEKALPFQLEGLIPYAIDEAIIKPLYTRSHEGTEARFFAVSKKSLESHLKTMQCHGIISTVVSTYPSALARFAAFACPSEMSPILFHLASKSLQIVSLKEGELFVHLTIHIGAKELKEDPSKFEKLQKELDRAFCFIEQKQGKETNRSLLLTGIESPKLKELIQKNPTLSLIEEITPTKFSPERLRFFAIPIGLALDALTQDGKSIQLLQGPYIAKGFLQKIKKKVLIGAFGSALLFILSFASLHLIASREESACKEKLRSLVDRSKAASDGLNAFEFSNSLSQDLNRLSTFIQLKKGKERLFSKPPLVSDALLFLETHPDLKGLGVKRIDYELKTYPTLEKPQENYLPKIHLTLETHEEKKARAFHDAIAEDKTIVDGSKGIEWKKNCDEYEITFYLR